MEVSGLERARGRLTFDVLIINNYIRGRFLNDLECSLSNVCYIFHKNNINTNEKIFKNEQRNRDGAAQKRATIYKWSRENHLLL